MNTPAHAVLNLLVLGRRDQPRLVLPVAAGAILPDLPMLAFYAHQKLVARTPEPTIWAQAYHDPGWQACFDLFHALPILALALLAALAARRVRWAALVASMALHALADLPLHRSDAHRHFFPISSWRFESPLSYWNPDFHGHWFATFELFFVGVGAGLLVRRHRQRSARWLLAGLVSAYVLYLAYAVVLWA